MFLLFSFYQSSYFSTLPIQKHIDAWWVDICHVVLSLCFIYVMTFPAGHLQNQDWSNCVRPFPTQGGQNTKWNWLTLPGQSGLAKFSLFELVKSACSLNKLISLAQVAHSTIWNWKKTSLNWLLLRLHVKILWNWYAERLESKICGGQLGCFTLWLLSAFILGYMLGAWGREKGC